MVNTDRHLININPEEEALAGTARTQKVKGQQNVLQSGDSTFYDYVLQDQAKITKISTSQNVFTPNDVGVEDRDADA